jgi:hypothetical protein
MHLRDRSGGHRLVIEALEELIQPSAQLLLDQGSGDLAVEGRELILQLREIGGEAFPEQIRARGEALTEFDEARPERLQGPSQTLAWPTRRLVIGEATAKPDDEARQRQIVKKEQGVMARQTSAYHQQPAKMPQ